MSLATTAAAIGIGTSLYNTFGKDNGGSSSSSTYVPTGLGGADQAWQQMLQQAMQQQGNIAGAANPAMMAAFNRMLGINTQPMIDAGIESGGYYGNLAQSQDAYHNLLVDAAHRDFAGQGRLQGAGDAIWNTALDPNNALRDRLAGQVGQQSRAASTARGIGMSPQSAMMETQALDRFGQDWQDRLLGRQATGLQGMAGAYDMGNRLGASAGQNLTGASNLGTMAAENLQRRGTTPIQMMMQAYGLPMQAAGMFTGAQGGVNQLGGNLMSQIIPYMNSGQGATNQAYGQGQTNLNNFTTGLQQLSKSPFLQNVWTPQPMNSQNTLGTSGNIFSAPPNYDYG